MDHRKGVVMAVSLGVVAFLADLAAAGPEPAGTEAPPGLTAVRTVVVDTVPAGIPATFQSHNQKVVSNGRGLFVAHIRSRNEKYTAQMWRLSWSRDGGETFVTLHEATHATNPPILETDAQNNVYMVRVDFTAGDAYLYRFRSADDYAEPTVTRIPRGAAGKYAMIFDAGRRRLYYFAHNNTFHVLDLEGKVLRSCDLLTAGKNAGLQYPLLSLDNDGTLYVAWTTQKHGIYIYWDIHCMRSRDGGESWRKLDGTPLTLPIVADDSGPTDRISGDDEFDAHTWLSSFMVKDGKLHFVYMAQMTPPRQHYVRYDSRTGKREIDLTPSFAGERIRLQGLDGFLAARTSLRDGPLYFVGHTVDGRIGCLASDDNGTTWYDYAVSDPFDAKYAVGGCREIVTVARGDAGHGEREELLVGSFSDAKLKAGAPEESRQVRFLKIRAGLAVVRVERAEFAGGVLELAFGNVRGQPARIRFRGPEGLWGEWRPFEPRMRLEAKERPGEFQLESRLGVVADAVALPRS